MGAALLLISAIVILAASATPAAAHPFGPPPVARIWIEGDEIIVQWGSAPDDAIAIGVEIGLLPEETIEAYLEEGPTRVAPSAELERDLSQSDDLRQYLLDRIDVTQDGLSCPGTVRPIGNFVTEGARVGFRCPEPPETVDIRIAMLHEIHEAYRTFAFAVGHTSPSQAVFSVNAPVHEWTFGTADEASRSSGWLGLVALGALAIGAIAGAEVLAARRRTEVDS